MNGEGAPAAAAAEPAAKPKKYRRPMLGPVSEILILLALLLAAGLALRAVPNIETGGNPLEHVGEFYRRTVVGVLQGRVLPLGLLLVGAAVGLGLLAALPGARPDLRGAAAGYAMLLLLGPVLNYGPQVEMLGMYPEDVPILAAELPPDVQANLHPERFNPMLPVTWPLAAVALLLLVWAVGTPRQDWPAAVKAGAVVTLLFVAGGLWLVHALNQARGNALSFPYTQWPRLTAAIAIVAQLGLAATGAAALGVDAKRSRIAAGLLAVMCLATALLAGGLR